MVMNKQQLGLTARRCEEWKQKGYYAEAGGTTGATSVPWCLSVESDLVVLVSPAPIGESGGVGSHA